MAIDDKPKFRRSLSPSREVASTPEEDPLDKATSFLESMREFDKKKKANPLLQRIDDQFRNPTYGLSPEEEADEITRNYMDVSKNQEEIDVAMAERAAERDARIAKSDARMKAAQDNLEQRRMLRGRITEAFGRGLSKENLDKEIGMMRGEAANLDIDPAAFDREVGEEQGLLDRQDSRNRRYEDFFARANDPNRTLGSGSRRQVYSRNRGLRLAKQLRKQGFGKAAEAAALDYARSPEAMAPAVSTPAMRQQREIDSSRASEIREMNRGLTQLLLARTRQQLRDPEFRPFA